MSRTRPSLPDYLVPTHLPADLAALIRAGNFREAETSIDAALEGGQLSPETAARLEQERERLRRLRRDYSLTEERLREKLRDTLPDATDADFERWLDAGAFQNLRIDGEVFYFKREPTNVLLFHSPARAMKERADKREKETSGTATVAGDPAGRGTARFRIED